jgi:hypothetical protein
MTITRTINVVVEPTEIVIVGSAALGPQGPPGSGGGGNGGGSDANYVHNQLSASAQWVVFHNLGKFPSVMVVDSGDTVIEPDIHYDNNVQLTIKFGSATSGKAYLN